MCWTPDNDKCPNCEYCFIARNQKICDNCKEMGY